MGPATCYKLLVDEILPQLRVTGCSLSVLLKYLKIFYISCAAAQSVTIVQCVTDSLELYNVC
jgi:hypothetical protein